MRIHHLNCGTLCPYCERLINGHGSWTKPGKMICHCMLIETNQGLVLVDTGFGTADIQNPGQLGKPFLALTGAQLDPKETALAQIESLGFKRSDVQHIVLTHLDLDHAGGISDFPHAKVHVYQPEHQAAMHPTWKEKSRYRPAHFKHNPDWVIHQDGGDQWFGFSGIQVIDGLSDDVALIPLTGHTQGHCGVAVRSAGGWKLHAGDAYFYHGQMEQQPNQPAGLKLFEKLVQINKKQRIENQLRLRELALEHKGQIEVFCAHDPVEFQRYV